MASHPSTALPPAAAPDAPQPWWRFRMVWLVIAGPATVVVAGIGTIVLAFLNIDPEVYDHQAAPPARLAAPATAAALAARDRAASAQP